MPRFSRASAGLAITTLCVVLAPLGVRAEAGPTSTASVHVVQAGDTLLQIALDAGTDTDTLIALNGLGDGNVLSVGQTVKLPAGASTGQPGAGRPISAPAAAQSAASSYTIVSGDNLWDVAQRFGTTSDAIVQLNHLDDADHLSVGTVLNLPAGSQARAAAGSGSGGGGASSSAAGSSSAATSSTSGGASPSGGAAAAPGPSAASSGGAATRSLMVSYTVQPGETLMQIARQFSVRPDDIVQATSLSDANKIVVGSVLRVPVAAKQHVVTDGETLRDIASAEKVDLGSIIDFNQIDDPALIHVGDVVLLPVAANQPTSSPAPAAAAPAVAPSATAKPTPAPQNPADAQVQTAAAVPAEPQAPVTPTAAKPPATPTPAASASPSPKPANSPTPTASPKPPAVGSAPAGAPSDALAGAGLKLLGDPYVWGGSTPSGFDCSGFVWYVARQLNKQLSRGMFGQYNSGSHPGRDELKPGDLVFFQNTYHAGLSHNGIYLGGDRFVHAADEADGVTISNLSTAYWSAHWFGATRLP